MEISAINHNRYNIATKSQYDTYPVSTEQNYPMYIEEEEQKPKSNLGLIALGILGAAGIAYGAYKHHDTKAVREALNKAKATIEENKTKITELEEKTSVAEKALETANAELEKFKNPTKKKFKLNLKFWTWFKNKKA